MIRSWYDLLIPGGTIVIECPDFDRDIEDYLAGNTERLKSIFGLQRYEGDTHYFGYNAERLEALFAQAGFCHICFSKATDYHAMSEPCLRMECRKPCAGSDVGAMASTTAGLAR
jgi:hypothetical protein